MGPIFDILHCHQYLSHNNSCFQCNMAIKNFLVSHTCEIKFHDVIGQITVHMYSYVKNSNNGRPKWPKAVCFGTLTC